MLTAHVPWASPYDADDSTTHGEQRGDDGRRNGGEALRVPRAPVPDAMRLYNRTPHHTTTGTINEPLSFVH